MIEDQTNSQMISALSGGRVRSLSHNPAKSRVDGPAIALQVADFLMRCEAERQRLFRLHLQATVRRVSPLLIDLAEFEELSLIDAVKSICPPSNWPWRPLDDYRVGQLNLTQRRKIWLRGLGCRDAWQFKRIYGDPGVVIRPTNHPNGRFAIRPSGAVLGFTAAIGPCLLTAFGSTAMLKLPDPLPLTLMESMVGRTLAEVVEHQIFVGRKYIIRRVVADPTVGVPVISFSARTLPFQGPWVPLPEDREVQR